MQEFYYQSTRGGGKRAAAAEAIISGIAGDGGLYVPSRIPKLDITLEDLLPLDYRGRAYHVMKPFLPDYTEAELTACIQGAYGEKFSVPGIAPLTKRAGTLFLELFHGPTLAFKDMALTLLPYLLSTALRKEGVDREVVILTATSGDTGKAALEGFAGIPGTRVIVFYPEQGVSAMQKRQMVTQEGDNTHVIGIEGNFDDAQGGVKEIFADAGLASRMDRRGYRFSSANSINVGRLIPQVAYYFHAYLQACAAGDISLGDPVVFVVPTGNFGNILAGFYAKMMGLPVGTLLCAANENRVLADFFATGVYDRRRELLTTMSPSMDILVSSNLERLLYQASGRDGEAVTRLMDELSREGRYRIPPLTAANLKDFAAGHASDEEAGAAILRVFREAGYVMDPHTAVAYSVWQKYRKEWREDTPAIILSTASPYKFARDVMTSLGLPTGEEDFTLLKNLSTCSGTPVPEALKALEKLPVRHRARCTRGEMREAVERILWG